MANIPKADKKILQRLERRRQKVIDKKMQHARNMLEREKSLLGYRAVNTNFCKIGSNG